MIHGVCWGIGQSTLARRLARAIPNADVLWEDEQSEPAIFTRPEFTDVADRFHAHNAQPDAGIGHPPPEMLEQAYRSLVRTVVGHGRTTLMAWSVMDLAEDLDWARADERALHEHARVVRAVLDPLDPVLVYLDGDLSVALHRAIEQRGRDWFARAYGRPGEEWNDLEPRLLSEVVAAAGRITRAFELGGWFPAVVVDATVLDADAVHRRVIEGLNERGVPIAA